MDANEGKKIKLTIQVLIPSAVSSGQAGQGQGGPRVMMRSAIGEDMADAVSKLQTKLPRKIFWGHCKTYIIGEKLAKAGGLHKQIDYLLRHPEPRERAYMFISTGEASNFLEAKPQLELFVGEGLRKISEMHIGTSTTLKDFEQMLTSDAGVALLPLIQTTEKHTDFLIGTAILKNDEMVTQVDTTLTRGLLWLRNKNEVTSVSVSNQNGGIVSIDPIRQKTKLIPSITDGKWSMLVKTEFDGVIVQNGSDIDIMEPTIIKKIESNTEKEIKGLIGKTLTQVQEEMNVDAFGFADAFHRKYPKEWEKVKDGWDKILPQVEVKIDVTMHIRRPGLSTKLAGMKD